MTNEYAIALQARIQDITRRISRESNHYNICTLYDKLELTIDQFSFELLTLPSIAKQKDSNGNLIYWTR